MSMMKTTNYVSEGQPKSQIRGPERISQIKIGVNGKREFDPAAKREAQGAKAMLRTDADNHFYR